MKLIKGWKGFFVGLLAGSMVMVSLPSLADTVKQYLTVEAEYTVMVNDVIYYNPDLPILNYEGSTYIPMRDVGEVLGADVSWNNELRRAEITYGDQSEEPMENSAFRNIEVSGSKGQYTVTGEARVFEAVMNYAVSDGHVYLLEDNYMLDEGAPAWSTFTLNINIPEEDLPENGTLTIELFEYSAKDGQQTNILVVPLETFN